MPICKAQDQTVYHPRNPKASPLWQCVDAHFEDFVHAYQARYEKSYGFFRPVIENVVHKFADCGDLHKGFAVVKCDHCQEKFIVALSLLTSIDPSCCEEDNETQEIWHGQKDSRIWRMADGILWWDRSEKAERKDRGAEI